MLFEQFRIGIIYKTVTRTVSNKRVRLETIKRKKQSKQKDEIARFSIWRVNGRNDGRIRLFSGS